MNNSFLTKVLSEELNWGKEQIKQSISKNSKYSTGKTGNSLSVVTESADNVVEGRIVTPLNWFSALEKGRGPIKNMVQSGFKEAMKAWASGAGLTFPSEQALENWARGYTYRVNRDGNKLFQSRVQRDIYSGILPNILERINSRLSGNLGKEYLRFGDIISAINENKLDI